MVTFSMPSSTSWAASSVTAPVVASTSHTLLIRRCSRGVRTQTLPNALATSIAQTRSMTNSYSESGISCGGPQANVGVGGQPNPIFTPARSPGNGTWGSRRDPLVACVSHLPVAAPPRLETLGASADHGGGCLVSGDVLIRGAPVPVTPHAAVGRVDREQGDAVAMG